MKAMRKARVSLFAVIFMASITTFMLYPDASSAETCEKPVAKVVSVQGTVEVQRASDTQWQPVTLHDTYCPGDTIRVQARSRADVSLRNQSVLRLSANTTITLEAVKEERTSVVGLLKGLAHFFSRGPRSLEVRTPFTVAGVRGTEFFIRVEDDNTFLSIFEGQVLASNQAGSLALTGGQSAVAEAGKAPVLRVVARPRDAVHWALYYPPVIYAQPDTLKAGVDWQRMVGTSLGFYLQGDVQKAFASIEKVPQDIREPRFFTYRASLLLAVGRVDEAKADIGRALHLSPNDSEALSLQTIIAVVQNDKGTALSLAQQAVQSDTTSATAHIALSYAQQAGFDLPGARASVQKAVELDAANALAWARLAELHSSFGDLSKALKAARQAVKLEPNLARTQTVLGFAYLTQVKTKQAKAAFEKAIVLDQADPLPRLGLGLAKIREGQLHEGRQDIEIAASLASNSSLIRSYLGKAYFEEKHDKLDEREYDMAKQLDPLDPTPWLYSAIQKQTTNRPVEALRDAQKAIELNDNRAVYRSRLLLDSDLAARSAGLARIYSDLGFQQLALVEGWKSVNTDPSNFSAHRFLADSYAALPRHEIARVSELLQSQLLQSINLTPIQPRLAESNLFLISAGGAGALSFNEFNPLFNQDRLAVQATGQVGENSTLAGEGVVSGIAGKASFSVGVSHFDTDGFRPNSDQEDDILNAFTQIELSHQTSIQGEFRRRDSERGDLDLRFFEDDFRPNERQSEDQNTIRLGARHAFSPGSIILSSFTYQRSEATTSDEPIDDPFLRSIDTTVDVDAVSGEQQYLLRTRYVTLVSGWGHFHIEGEDTTTLALDFGLPPPPIGPGLIIDQTTSDLKIDHTNAYVYGYISILKNVTITLGVSGDLFRGNEAINNLVSDDTEQVNPKFGITWTPFRGTTVRAAIFRVFKRTLITDQTLEPTQVAGFNQFFDDITGTDAWRYGLALDQKLTTHLFAGMEFSKRDLDVPFSDFSDPANPILREVDWEEYLVRAYLFWTPHDWLAFRLGYLFERFERDDAFTAGVKEVDTHRVPVGISVFHPSGLSASVTATYFNQDGRFGEGFAGAVFRSGDDDFWIVDAAINFRLPKRYGFITIGATNLLDEKFQYFETDFDNPTIIPDRVAFARVTLVWP
jgi:tetratricopeptide (TPR) repeat protein